MFTLTITETDENGSSFATEYKTLTGYFVAVVSKVNSAEAELSGSQGGDVTEISAAIESAESADVSTPNPATTSTTSTARTTFDELMQALSELEADDPLPSSGRQGPSWREFCVYYISLLRHLRLRFALHLRFACD